MSILYKMIMRDPDHSSSGAGYRQLHDSEAILRLNVGITASTAQIRHYSSTAVVENRKQGQSFSVSRGISINMLAADLFFGCS
jgi:hypothetical protein